jgi:required for meiotic nuclear division protein 1
MVNFGISGMEKTLKLSAILIANQLDLRGIKSSFKTTPLAESSTELLYGFENGSYQCYFSYGVVTFAGYSEEEIKKSLENVQPFTKSLRSAPSRSNYEISIVPHEMVFESNRLIVDHVDDKVARIAMLNLAQSVTLEKYHEVMEDLLTEVKNFTHDLEKNGSLNVSRKTTLKFIGKSLNTRNDIADNIYIFDVPQLLWGEEYLNRLNEGLIRYFDLRVRFSEIRYTIRIIEGNLDTFLEISNQRQSSTLEWVIIIMILVELINMFLSKLM